MPGAAASRSAGLVLSWGSAVRVVNVMLSAGAGGLEAVGFQYARLLAEAGHDSWMICHRKSPYANAFGEKVIALPNASITNPLAHLRLALALRRLRPDVVFCHGHRAAQFYTPFLRALFPHPSLSSLIPHFISVCHGANGWRCRKFPRTIAVSDGVRDELVNKWHLDPASVVTIPNAVPIPHPPVRRSLVEGGSSLSFGFLGRLDHCKGVDILLRAFSEMLQTPQFADKRPRLYIGGTGPEESALRSLASSLGIESQIVWMGWVSDKASFFSQIDVLLMPSREEALGLSMLEAMAYQKPVIASDCPGPAALVRPSHAPACGLVVPRQDVESLAAAMAQLATDPAACAAFATAGRKLVESQFSEAALLKGLVTEMI